MLGFIDNNVWEKVVDLIMWGFVLGYEIKTNIDDYNVAQTGEINLYNHSDTHGFWILDLIQVITSLLSRLLGIIGSALGNEGHILAIAFGCAVGSTIVFGVLSYYMMMVSYI